MKILLINKFLYPKGGDAVSTIITGKLLTSKGNVVAYWGMKHSQNPRYPLEEYFVDNVEYNKNLSLKEQFKLVCKILYSIEAKKKIEEVIKKEKPDIVHLNNYAHQISPSIIHVFKKYKIPAVMTIRDFKLVCPAYSMLLNHKPCERCCGGKYYECLLNKCMKESYFKSFISTIEMYLHHKILHVYNYINCFIATSRFVKLKMLDMGFKGNLTVLPNFSNFDNRNPEYNWKENTCIYYGRLSEEKGLITLIDAIKDIKGIGLKIIGNGPLKERLLQKIQAENINNVFIYPHQSEESLEEEIKKSMFTIIPSEWYEPFGRTIIEAASLGKTTVGSRIGGIPEIIIDGKTGVLFEPGNVKELKEKILYLIHNPHKIIEYGKNAKIFVEDEFGPEKHYTNLMDIYHQALKTRF